MCGNFYTGQNTLQFERLNYLTLKEEIFNEL